MTDIEKEVVALCAEWRQRLRLQDWDVEVEVVRGDEMPGSPTGAVSGCIDYWSRKRFAKIHLIDPVDYPRKPARREAAEQNMELDLVHELLHLYWVPFEVPEDSPLEIAMEQAIDALSKALVKLKRREST